MNREIGAARNNQVVLKSARSGHLGVVGAVSGGDEVGDDAVDSLARARQGQQVARGIIQAELAALPLPLTAIVVASPAVRGIA